MSTRGRLKASLAKKTPAARKTADVKNSQEDLASANLTRSKTSCTEECTEELLSNFVNNISKICSRSATTIEKHHHHHVKEKEKRELKSENVRGKTNLSTSRSANLLARFSFQPLLPSDVYKLKGIWGILKGRYLLVSYKKDPGWIVSLDLGENFPSSEVTVLSKVKINVQPNQCLLKGDCLYVCTDSGDFYIISVANPASLEIIGSTSGPESQMFNLVISEDERFAFATNTVGRGILVFRIENKREPVFVHSVDFVAGGMVLKDSYLIVTNFAQNELRVYSTGDAPTLHLQATLSDLNKPVTVIADPSRPRVYVGSYDSPQIWCVDISNPRKPSIASSVQIRGNKQPHFGSMNIHDNFLYVVSSNGEMSLIDLSTSEICLVGGYNLELSATESSLLTSVDQENYLIVPTANGKINFRHLNFNQAIYSFSSSASSSSSENKSLETLRYTCFAGHLIDISLPSNCTVKEQPSLGSLGLSRSGSLCYLANRRASGVDSAVYASTTGASGLILIHINEENTRDDLFAVAGNKIYQTKQEIDVVAAPESVEFALVEETAKERITACTYNRRDKLLYYLANGDGKIYMRDCISGVSKVLTDTNVGPRFAGAPGLTLSEAGLTYADDILYLGTDPRSQGYYRIVLESYDVSSETQKIYSIDLITPDFNPALEAISMAWNSQNSTLVVCGILDRKAYVFVCDAETGSVLKKFPINILGQKPKIAFGSDKNLYMLYPALKKILTLNLSSGTGREFSSFSLENVNDIC